MMYRSRRTLLNRGKVVMTGTTMMITMAIILSACGSTASVSRHKTRGAHGASLPAEAKAAFPNGVTLVSGQPPGGLLYVASEALQPSLQKALGVPVTIVQKPGGGGKVAAAYVYHSSPASGNVFLSLIPNMAIAQVVGGGSFNLDRFTPLAGIYGDDTSIYVAKKASPLTNFRSLKNSTKTLTIGVVGIKATSGWFSAALLAKVDHVRLTVVGFTTGSEAIDAVLSGAIDMASVTRALAVPLLNENKIQAVLEFAPKPLSYLPGTETIAQAGYPNQSFYNLVGAVGPPGMSKQASGVLAAAFASVAKSASFVSTAKSLHLAPVYASATKWQQETASIVNVIRSRAGVLVGG